MGLFGSTTKNSSKKSNLDYNGDYLILNKDINERKLQETGLRGKKLFTVVCCVIFLWLLSIGTFVCNAMILVVLRMNHKGMETVQFQETVNGHHTIRFTGQRTHFDSVVPRSGLISSAGKSKFEIRGNKIQLVNKRKGKDAYENVASSITLEKDHVKMEGVKDLYIADPQTSHVIFEASKPTFRLENKSIKKISADSIKANKVRAPIDQHLSIDVETLIFKGNEGNYFSGRNIFLRALNNVTFKTNDKGTMTFTAAKGVRLSVPGLMKVSNSPHFSADIQGKRLCACEDTGKLFTVPGNKPCAINPAYCF